MENQDWELKGATIIVGSIITCIIVICFCSNILAFVIFSRKKFHHTIFYTYFRIMILIDQFSYLIRIDILLNIFGLSTFRSISPFSCKLISFLIPFTRSILPWILVLISIDRMLSIVCPNRFYIRKKPLFQMSLCFIVLLTSACLSIRFIFETNFEYSSTNRRDNNSSQNSSTTLLAVKNICNDRITMIYDLFYYTLIPFLLMFISTIITIKFIYESRKKSNNNKTKIKDIRFAITSITLNILFFLFYFPLFFFFFLENFINISEEMSEFISNIFRAILYLYSGSLFFSTLIVNSLFRQEFYLFLDEIKHFKCFKLMKL